MTGTIVKTPKIGGSEVVFGVRMPNQDAGIEMILKTWRNSRGEEAGIVEKTGEKSLR